MYLVVDVVKDAHARTHARTHTHTHTHTRARARARARTHARTHAHTQTQHNTEPHDTQHNTTQHHTTHTAEHANFRGSSAPLSSDRRTLKQQLNGEKPNIYKATTSACGFYVFVPSVWKLHLTCLRALLSICQGAYLENSPVAM